MKSDLFICRINIYLSCPFLLKGVLRADPADVKPKGIFLAALERSGKLISWDRARKPVRLMAFPRLQQQPGAALKGCQGQAQVPAPGGLLMQQKPQDPVTSACDLRSDLLSVHQTEMKKELKGHFLQPSQSRSSVEGILGGENRG